MTSARNILRLIFWTGAVLLMVYFVDFSTLQFKRDQDDSAYSQQPASTLRNENSLNEKKEFEGTAEDIIALVNQARQENGQKILKRNDQLMQSAQLKAEHMKNNRYFDHVSPDGVSYTAFVERVDYPYQITGENLALGYFSAQEVHAAWMDSEGHRHNILSPDYEEIGVAIMPFEDNGRFSYILVQHFGTQFKPRKLVTKTVCDLSAKQECQQAKDDLAITKKTIEKQEDAIDVAQEREVDKVKLKKAKENLERLEENQEKLEAYIKICSDFIKKCDSWQ